MRLPFFSSRADAPVRVPLPETHHIGFGIYFRAEGPSAPGAEEVKGFITAWLEQHADERMRAAIGGNVDQFLKLDVRESHSMPAPPAELLGCMGAGEEELGRFRQSTHVVMLAMPDKVGPPHIGLWSATAAARAVADALDGVIFDPELPRLLPLAANREGLPAEWGPKVAEHIMLPFSVDRRGLGWLTTKGMGKFGLPELEIRNVPPDLGGMLGNVVNGLARWLVARVAVIAGENEVPRELLLNAQARISLADLAGDEAEKPVEPPEGVRGWTTIRFQYRPGRRGASSFLSLLPPRGFHGSQGVWLHSLLSDLFGSEDPLCHIDGNSESMEAAHLQAVSELPLVKRRFQAGLDPGETLFVKHGFPVGDDGHEYMWIVVNNWGGDRLIGQLANDPQTRLDMRAGQLVELQEADVYDWMISLPDDRREGNYTGAVLEREGQRAGG